MADDASGQKRLPVLLIGIQAFCGANGHANAADYAGHGVERPYARFAVHGDAPGRAAQLAGPAKDALVYLYVQGAAHFLENVAFHKGIEPCCAFGEQVLNNVFGHVHIFSLPTFPCS